MPPEETATPDTPQPTQESPTPAIETPAPVIEPAMSPQEASPVTTAHEVLPAPAVEPVTPPETPPAPVEPAPAIETGPQGPLPVSKTDDRQETQVAQSPTPTAQIPPSEPIAPKPEPIEPEPIRPPSAAAQAPTGILHTARDLLTRARVAIQDRKRKKRDKIMAALNTKNKITNDEVEKLLHVSDATATRYLSALEKEGKIIQVGKQGKGILYIKTP